MKSTSFKEQNIIFAENQDEYQSLPAFSDTENGAVTSCWEITDEEIEILKKTKKIYIRSLTFNQPLQPLFASVKRIDMFSRIGFQSGQKYIFHLHKITADGSTPKDGQLIKIIDFEQADDKSTKVFYSLLNGNNEAAHSSLFFYNDSEMAMNLELIED